MIAFRHIFCPIDFSETSTRALAYATAVARWYDAKLTVLHVVTTFDEGFSAGADRQRRPGPYPGSRDDVVARIRRAVDQAGGSDLRANALAREGHAPELIVNSAGLMKADLLVVGTHGSSGFRRLLLGSVTEDVVRRAACPVLTVPPAVSAAPSQPILFKRILCPIDYSLSALKALDYALELGRQSDGRVTVLHALEYMEPLESDEPSEFDPCRETILDNRRRQQHLIDHQQVRLHALLTGESRSWCEIEEVVATNRAYKEILQRAAASDADLIVMGAQGSRGLALTLYGSNTHQVVRAATCPVLTVRA